ncbi:MAG: GrpB family protein [Deltaproteobacteria bacterium]|nr:MAG: GrpB family protein [Deltaproteobacteria bacterium]
MRRSDESPETATPEFTSEQRLAAITIGERVPLNDTIGLAPYDPAWPMRFSELALRVREALSDAVLLLEHVGSTSVPDLCAKPIIDMVLAVADASDEAAYVPALEACGFTLRIREPDWYEHRLLECLDIDAHLHVFSSGCPEIGRMLDFRDRLRAHEGDRRRYEEVKRTLAARKWRHVQHYADAKSGIVREILERAHR